MLQTHGARTRAAFVSVLYFSCIFSSIFPPLYSPSIVIYIIRSHPGWNPTKHWLAVTSILLIVGAVGVAVPLALRVSDGE